MRAAWCLGTHPFDVRTLDVSAEERVRISELKQGSPEWLQARYGRLTASNFGAAAGHHLPGARTKLLQAMVWPETHVLEGRAAEFAAYGTANEPVARDVYVKDRQSRGVSCVRVYETGLLVSEEFGWLGSSPDFIVEEYTAIHERKQSTVVPLANEHHARAPYIIEHPLGAAVFCAAADAVSGDVDPSLTLTRGCGEIKCPATHKLYSSSAKHAKYGFPDYYYDQIQGIMAINDWPWCDTVVYTPTRTEVIRFYANKVYWTTELLPALRSFYFDEFLPRLNMRISGRLTNGAIDPVMNIPACLADLGVDLDLGLVSKRPTKKKKAKVCVYFSSHLPHRYLYTRLLPRHHPHLPRPHRLHRSRLRLHHSHHTLRPLLRLRR